jgi:transcriptional regulator with XRE-family HTH domain
MPIRKFSERIKQTRESRGISASQFARSVGVTPTCVWNWERGATTPRPPALEAICKALEVEPSFLFGGEPQPQHVTNNDVSPTRVDDILDEAGEKIATLLGISRERIKIRFEVSPES